MTQSSSGTRADSIQVVKYTHGQVYRHYTVLCTVKKFVLLLTFTNVLSIYPKVLVNCS